MHFARLRPPCAMHFASSTYTRLLGPDLNRVSFKKTFDFFTPGIHLHFSPDHVMVILVPNWSRSFWTLSMLHFASKHILDCWVRTEWACSASLGKHASKCPRLLLHVRASGPHQSIFHSFCTGSATHKYGFSQWSIVYRFLSKQVISRQMSRFPSLCAQVCWDLQLHINLILANEIHPHFWVHPPFFAIPYDCGYQLLLAQHFNTSNTVQVLFY